jgi:hypothetical protein
MIGELLSGMIGGATWGAGFVAVAATAAVAGPRAKHVAKAAIKGAISASRRAREFGAEAVERAQDLYAEAKHEFESELLDGNGSRARSNGANGASARAADDRDTDRGNGSKRGRARRGTAGRRTTARRRSAA